MKNSILIIAWLAACAASVDAQPIPDVVVYGRAVKTDGSSLSSNAIVTSIKGTVSGFTFSAAAATQGSTNFYILRIPADDSNGIYKRANAIWINDPIETDRTLTITISNVTVQQRPLVLAQGGPVRYDIAVSGSPPKPRIVQQPSAQSVAVGGYAIFVIGATGQTPLSYQWFFNTNQPLPGATNSMLVIDPVQCSSVGTYGVVVSNSLGSVASTWATLTVTSAGPPTVTEQPQSKVAARNTGVSFTIRATGACPLWYQWYFNGQSIRDATNAVLVLPAVQPTNAGPYFAVVTNSVGSVTTAVATLTVTLPVLAPTTISYISGTNLTYSGGAGSQFVLLKSSNAAALLSDWTRVATNTATPGTFPVSVVSAHAAFYRIKSE